MNTTVCIPTYNEEDSIGSVVSEISNKYDYDIIVIDGVSTDNTCDIAEKEGAKVMTQTYPGGKGSAMREVIDRLNTDIIVFIDGDGTYEIDDIGNMVQIMMDDSEVDQVIASRFSDMQKGAMSPLHRFGNRCINILFTSLYFEYPYDLLTGLRAIRIESFDFELDSKRFDIETEITAKSVRKGHKIEYVGTSYYEREGESKLQSFNDGLSIGKRIFKERI